MAEVMDAAPLRYIDRYQHKILAEKVYKQGWLKFLYGPYGKWLLPFFAKSDLFSRAYGAFQKTRFSRSKILPFIHAHDVDVNEFLEPPKSFFSFNDFFIRKLKSSARPIAKGSQIAVMPADGRYLFYADFSKAKNLHIKGQELSLDTLLGSKELAEKFRFGVAVIARLCPSDYHRFHFPVDGIASKAQLINGYLYSVNPLALKQNWQLFSQNKRMVTLIETEKFGSIAYVEVGATCVGSIHQSYEPDSPIKKGEEKGYFSFGGSSLVLLFEPGRLQLADDLLEMMQEGLEIKCLMGQPLGSLIT